LTRERPSRQTYRVGFLCFGLTGGLASGKSTVSERWRRRGLAVVDADELAREVVAPGSEGLAELVATFGSDILDGAGRLDRKRLAERAFCDEHERRKLEAITHPRIIALSSARVASLRDAGHPLVSYEAALLVESGRADAFRPLVVVVAPVELQITRAVERATLQSGRAAMTREQALARIQAQLPLEAKAAAADYVIDNSGDRAALVRQADLVLDQIARSQDIDPVRYPAA
jgi:dephospho-CoA kinase